MELTEKEQEFVSRYSALFSVEEASRGLYPLSEARQLFRSPYIQQAINKFLQHNNRISKIHLKTVIQQLIDIATADPSLCFNPYTNRPIPIHDIPKSLRNAIQSYEVEHDGSVKIKLWKKVEALALLGKHLGAFIDQLDVKVTLEQLVLESMRSERIDVAPSPILPVSVAEKLVAKQFRQQPLTDGEVINE